jgi:hypothetical protein
MDGMDGFLGASYTRLLAPEPGGVILQKVPFFRSIPSLPSIPASNILKYLYIFCFPVRTGKNPVPTVHTVELGTRLVVRDAFIERVEGHLEDLR